jgi:predicted aspartyl protease
MSKKVVYTFYPHTEDNIFNMKPKILLFLFLFTSPDAFATVTSWQDVEIRNGRVFIDVEIAGFPAKALLDSGSGLMSISSSFIEENAISYVKGEEYTVLGANGRSRAHKIREIDVSILGLQLPIRNAGTFKSGRKYQMIIGIPFLQLVIIQIDYPNSRIRFFSRDSVDLKNQANVAMKLESQHSRLVTTIDLGGEDELDLLFDTGSTAGIVLNRHYAENRGWLEKYRLEEGKLAGIGSIITVEKLHLPYLKFGPYELENVKVIVPKEETSKTNYSQNREASTRNRRQSKGAGYVGILGGDVFKHFVVTLDAKNALMHIAAPQPD